jgi:hypothetical protein
MSPDVIHVPLVTCGTSARRTSQGEAATTNRAKKAAAGFMTRVYERVRRAELFMISSIGDCGFPAKTSFLPVKEQSYAETNVLRTIDRSASS